MSADTWFHLIWIWCSGYFHVADWGRYQKELRNVYLSPKPNTSQGGVFSAGAAGLLPCVHQPSGRCSVSVWPGWIFSPDWHSDPSLGFGGKTPWLRAPWLCPLLICFLGSLFGVAFLPLRSTICNASVWERVRRRDETQGEETSGWRVSASVTQRPGGDNMDGRARVWASLAQRLGWDTLRQEEVGCEEDEERKQRPGLGRSPGEGNSYPLQYSGLENSMDRGAWRATVHGVTKSQTGLSDFHSTPCTQWIYTI